MISNLIGRWMLFAHEHFLLISILVKRKIKVQGQTLTDIHEGLGRAFNFTAGPAQLYEFKIEKTVYRAPIFDKKPRFVSWFRRMLKKTRCSNSFFFFSPFKCGRYFVERSERQC